MKKTIIIVALVIVVAIVALVLIFSRSQTPGTTGGAGGGTTGTLPPATLASSTYSPPTGPTFVIGTGAGGVTVTNFYTTAKSVSHDQTSVLVAETDTYNITYYVPDSSFNILIAATPFDAVRTQAEAAFLAALGISQADACKLNVKVGTTVDVDPAHAGENLGLSFCAAGAF